MSQHYHCDGCRKVSYTDRVCIDEKCVKYTRDLMECDCIDGKHKDDRPWEREHHRERIHRLNAIHFGIAIGSALGVYFFFIGLIAWLAGWGMPLLELLSRWYIGYAPTFIGSVLGLFWGFVDGFIGGVIIAWVYNLLQKMREDSS